MLDVVPPGMQPMMRSPIFTSGLTGSSTARVKPTSGMTPYCETRPMKSP
jgi:hypothetical protein